MKVLLLEWMQRRDGPYRYYSNASYNMNEGGGDLQEIRNRRTWRRVPLWLSDATLKFGQPIQVSTPPDLFSATWSGVRYVRNEYLYVGRTVDGEALLWFDVQGPDAFRFSVFPDRARLVKDGYARIKVTYSSGSNFGTNVNETSAYLRVRVSMDGATTYRNVPILCVQDDLDEEVLVVRPTLRSNRVVEPATPKPRRSNRRSRDRKSSVAWAAGSIACVVVVAATIGMVLAKRRSFFPVPAFIASSIQPVSPHGSQEGAKNGGNQKTMMRRIPRRPTPTVQGDLQASRPRPTIF
jgi:hypothetical protein